MFEVDISSLESDEHQIIESITVIDPEGKKDEKYSYSGPVRRGVFGTWCIKKHRIVGILPNDHSVYTVRYTVINKDNNKSVTSEQEVNISTGEVVHKDVEIIEDRKPVIVVEGGGHINSVTSTAFFNNGKILYQAP